MNCYHCMCHSPNAIGPELEDVSKAAEGQHGQGLVHQPAVSPLGPALQVWGGWQRPWEPPGWMHIALSPP